MEIQEIKINSEKYPDKLKNIYDPPQVLYAIGNIEILNQQIIAIVGTRKATEYGKKTALELSKQLSQKGVNIISGLAIGIDSYAHMGTIFSKQGKTIAILGSPIENIYPKQNIKLAREILKKGGCIITEYKKGIPIKKKNFPQRNRIISGLSDGILVVEATEKSGALITAEFGLEQGKEIFAIPGDINKAQSRGCNLLIKDGAKIVLSAQEILEEIEIKT